MGTLSARDATASTNSKHKYLEPRFAQDLIRLGSIKVGTLTEYRAMEGLDPERGDAHEGKLTLQSPTGRHVYGGDPATLPPPLRHPLIRIGPRRFVADGEGAITLDSTIPDLFRYCTTEAYDPDYGRRFGNGKPMDCVRINDLLPGLDPIVTTVAFV